MDKPIKRSDLYIFGNPRGFDELTPIAVVLGRNDTVVTYSIYLDHGRIYDRSVRIPAEEFDHYYHPINDVEYDVLKCLGYMQLEGGMQNGQS